jgi:AcrR family transcriptional regulator
MPSARSVDELRLRILEQARVVFLRSSFEDANLDEIASLANVGKGTIYRHFDSKAALFVRSLRRDCLNFEERIGRAMTPGASALQQLREIADSYWDYWESHPEHLRLFCALRGPALSEELSDELLEVIEGLCEGPLRMLAAVIEGGVARGELAPCDPWLTANVVWRVANAMIDAAFDRVQARLLPGHGADPSRALYDAALAQLRRALQPDRAPTL